MSSKRVKISFETINAGNYTVIDKNDIAATNQRVKEVMKDVVRKYEKNATISKQNASKLVLNA